MASRVEQARELQERTKRFAVRVVQAFSRITKNEAARVIGRQFRAACRARSAADFISKINVVTEEGDETLFRLELLVDSGLVNAKIVEPIIAECTELLKIFSSSLATAKANR